MKQTAYLIIENRTKRKDCPEFTIIGTRSLKPSLSPQQVAIKLNVEIPDRTFEQFIPEASISVPGELMLRPDVAVEVTGPDELAA